VGVVPSESADSIPMIAALSDTHTGSTLCFIMLPAEERSVFFKNSLTVEHMFNHDDKDNDWVWKLFQRDRRERMKMDWERKRISIWKDE
jgi:hypothetical protein